MTPREHVELGYRTFEENLEYISLGIPMFGYYTDGSRRELFSYYLKFYNTSYWDILLKVKYLNDEEYVQFMKSWFRYIYLSVKFKLRMWSK